MKGKYFYRIINTAVTAAGALICIVSGFIPAPYGLLSEGTISLIQSLPDSQKAARFLLPAMLFLAAAIMVGAGLNKIVSLITVLAGACIFAWMDLTYIRSSMAFTGTLANEIGIVIALAGVLLYALGTPKEKQEKPESKFELADPLAELDAVSENNNEPNPDVAVSNIQSGSYDGSEDTIVLEPVSWDTMEFGDTNAPAEENSAETIADESSPQDEPLEYTQVLWTGDDELEALTSTESDDVDDHTIVFDANFEDLVKGEE